MNRVFLVLANMFLKKNHGLFILIAAFMCSTILFSYKILSYQNGLSKDELYYVEFVDKFSGELTNKKTETIERINNEFQKDEYTKLLEDYKNDKLSENEYILKQNALSKKLIKKNGFDLFYKQYLDVKNNTDLQICNNEVMSVFTISNFDYIQIFVTLYMIYIIFLKDYDTNMILYEKITSGGRKFIHISKILIFFISLSIFIAFINAVKIFILSHYINLDFSIYNIKWVSKETVNITLWQFYVLGSILMIIGSMLLTSIAIFLNGLIKKTSLVLVFVFALCYIIKGFFGSDPLLLYFPFVSFLIPGKYFAGIGETMHAFDIRILFIQIVIALVFIIIILWNQKKLLLSLICLCVFTGCSENSFELSEVYNSYQNISFGESDKYLSFDDILIDKDTLSIYSIYRDPMEASYFLDSKSVFNDHIIYIATDENDNKKIYNLDLNSFSTSKIDDFSLVNQNYLNINEKTMIENFDSINMNILGNKDNYIYVYNNMIKDKNKNILIEGDFSNVISLYDNYIYSLQGNNQIVKYSLKTKKKYDVDTVLCDYFFINDGNIYCHSIKDKKIYNKRKLIFDIPVYSFDIHGDTVYYDNEEGVYSYNLANKLHNQISSEKGYSIKVSNENKYLYYIGDAKEAGKNISLNIIDLNTNKLLKSIEY